ncbi:LOW QUALITY PROTEIN: neugrin-like [Nerophis lumbriciformis]|uniref:LOW QUALITY PROTEIN: neugrin-like n=1 Tax=Nerophis lumbriciformis TaxID=546530 RepID=UPI003BA8D542
MAGRLPVLSMLASLGIRTRLYDEDVEDKLEALLKEREKNRNATKYNIIKRKMRPPGAPERKLSWQAIEQITFLKQEQPDEWSVKHLAEGFSVGPDEIVRVLKSKFIPDPARKLKQDAKAMTRLNPQVLPSGSGAEQTEAAQRPHSRCTLPSGSQENSLVPVAAHTLIGGNTNSDNKSLAVASAPVTAPSRFNSASNKDATEKTTAGDNSSHPAEEEEENWDGEVLSEEQIAQIWEMKKPAPALQVGKDFFDGEGNFLYRI